MTTRGGFCLGGLGGLAVGWAGEEELVDVEVEEPGYSPPRERQGHLRVEHLPRRNLGGRKRSCGVARGAVGALPRLHLGVPPTHERDR
eukprot:CAMPEP_0172635676 /NCGR_PEP_ID=MMETSP1068-20121228/200559_1 /TAXON_ID=35684 /ORGANISM="Pseudopedinella elastica, Strain CCMP716" /LENGTH=87 /DNA_ID=CAMNT_0013447965 /DNA_START=38 /DNA_END=297 /DNA_ORIENTATION=-